MWRSVFYSSRRNHGHSWTQSLSRPTEVSQGQGDQHHEGRVAL
jgi:hypothetical protein